MSTSPRENLITELKGFSVLDVEEEEEVCRDIDEVLEFRAEGKPLKSLYEVNSERENGLRND